MSGRGVLTIEDLKARCKVDPVRHCWIWQGAASGGQPRIWTLDYERVVKRCMSGPLAAWHIAYNAPPRDGHLIFRGCVNALCLNPAHLRQARDKVEIGLHIRRTGVRVGTHLEQRRANAALARLAQGCKETPAHVVQQIRAAPPEVTSVSLSRTHQVRVQTVSMIRRGARRRLAGAAA